MSRAVSSALPAIDPPVRELRVNASAFAGAAMLAATAAVAVSSDPWRMIVMVLMAPIVEEAVFRAGLQEWLLRRCRPAFANAASATAFVLAHCLLRGPSVISLAVAGPALVLGWVYGRYRSLRLCIALHMLMNLVWATTGQWLASFL